MSANLNGSAAAVPTGGPRPRLGGLTPEETAALPAGSVIAIAFRDGTGPWSVVRRVAGHDEFAGLKLRTESGDDAGYLDPGRFPYSWATINVVSRPAPPAPSPPDGGPLTFDDIRRLRLPARVHVRWTRKGLRWRKDRPEAVLGAGEVTRLLIDGSGFVVDFTDRPGGDRIAFPFSLVSDGELEVLRAIDEPAAASPPAQPDGPALLSALGSLDAASRQRFVNFLIDALQDATPDQWARLATILDAVKEVACRRGPAGAAR